MSVLSAATQDLVAVLKLNNQFSGPLNKASRDLTKFDAQVATSGTRAFQAGQQIGNGIKNLAKVAVAGAALAGAGIAAVAVKSLSIAGDFESQLNVINTIAHESASGIKTIGDGVRQIARDTGTSLDDLTSGYYDLLSAGIKTADAQKVLVEANKLAIGGLGTTSEAVDLLTTAINVYGGDAKKAGEYTDVFAKAVERGKVTTSELASSFSIVGPLAQSTGISIQEIGAGFARLTANGIPAAEAATDMRSALQSLTKTTPELEALEKQTGKNYKAIAGQKGLAEAFQQMRTDAAKAGIPLEKLTGRVEAQQYILATTGPNFKAYNADLAAMGSAAGTAASQMAEREQGLNFQLGRLKALAKDAGITIGSALLPKITPLIEKLNSFVSGHQADISKFGDSIASLFSDANIKEGASILTGVFQAAKETAPVIAASARLTGQVIAQSVNLFRSLPTELQTLLVAGLAVNKLTGGLVTNLAGGLISAVISSFKGLMNVNAAVVNVNGPVGGLGGIAGEAAGVAGGVSLATIGVVAAAAVASAFAFSQTHSGAGSTGAFTPTVGAAFDQNGLDPNLFSGIDWRRIGKELQSGSEGESQLRNAAHGMDTAAAEHSEAASQLRNAAHGLQGSASA